MLSLLKYALESLFGSKKSQTYLDKREYTEKDALNKIEYILEKLKRHKPEEKSNIAADFSTEENTPSLCEYRTGVITGLFADYGLIDNLYYFNFGDRSVSIEIGSKVSYVAYRCTPLEQWRVKRILYSWDEDWDEKHGGNVLPSNDKRETSERKIVGQIIERTGREIIISPDLRCNLDDVSLEFIPEKGDWIVANTMVEVDTGVTDMCGEVLHISSINPLRTRLITGTITDWNETNGTVEKYIFFSKSQCYQNYNPSIGDKVLVAAIESNCNGFVWRAVELCPTESKVSARKVEKYPEQYITDLLQNKNDVFLSSETNIQLPTLGASKDVIVEIENRGINKQVLLRCKSELKDSQVFLPYKCNFTINPSRTFKLRLQVKGKTAGISSELVTFMFSGFAIGLIFNIEVNPTSNVNTSSRHFSRQRKKYVPDHVTDKMTYILPGVRPSESAPFIPVRLGSYDVPKYLWNLLLKNHEEGIDSWTNIEEVCKSLLFELTNVSYREKFHTLLHIEEVAQVLEIQNYNMISVTLTPEGPGGDFLALEVPGLSEKRPSLIIGDRVIASSDIDKGVSYEGFVHKVLKNRVWLKFNAAVHINCFNQQFNISFLIHRTPIRRCHAAVDLAVKNLGHSILFPSVLQIKDAQLTLIEESQSDAGDLKAISSSLLNNVSKRTIKWFNKNLNYYQKEAVKNILKGEARPLPYVIFGPPGTGKTITLVEAVLQIWSLLPDSRILIATPSNSSANLIAERLLDFQCLQPGDLVRFVAHYLIEDGSLPERLIPYSTSGEINCKSGKEEIYLSGDNLKQSSTAGVIGRHRITIGTCVALGQIIMMGFPKGHFTHVVIDEAGQATEPECFIPLCQIHPHWGQIIMAGDPMQLGPVVTSSVAKKYGLGLSYLSRLLHRTTYLQDHVGFPGKARGYNPQLVTWLVMNYRAMPEILQLYSGLFYQSQLEAQVNSSNSNEAIILQKLQNHLPNPKFPVVFHGVRGTNYQDSESPSWYNPQEIVQVLSYVRAFYEEGFMAADIGIITPYLKQVRQLRSVFEELSLPCPKTGSVEEFQGQERNIIILSTVRSSPELIQEDLKYALGFLVSPNRVNVAISRARAILVIIGNPHLLAREQYWRGVLTYCVENQAYTGCDLPNDIFDTPPDLANFPV